MSTQCISCGMPLEKKEDYPLGDMSKDYCLHCARPDGALKSYDEALAGMSAFMVKTQGLDEAAAGNAAKTLMAKMPAWQGI